MPIGACTNEPLHAVRLPWASPWSAGPGAPTSRAEPGLRQLSQRPSPREPSALRLAGLDAELNNRARKALDRAAPVALLVAQLPVPAAAHCGQDDTDAHTLS